MAMVTAGHLSSRVNPDLLESAGQLPFGAGCYSITSKNKCPI